MNKTELTIKIIRLVQTLPSSPTPEETGSLEVTKTSGEPVLLRHRVRGSSPGCRVL